MIRNGLVRFVLELAVIVAVIGIAYALDASAVAIGVAGGLAWAAAALNERLARARVTPARAARRPAPQEPRAVVSPPRAPDPPVAVAASVEPPRPRPAEAARVAVVAAPPVEAPPRSWNVWELERRVRDRGGVDVAKDEERHFLLVYLREFADADGNLAPDFDALVRETFSDLLATS